MPERTQAFRGSKPISPESLELSRSKDPQHMTAQSASRRPDRQMHALRLARFIGVESACNDTHVLPGGCNMEAEEVLAVMSDDCATAGGSKGEHFFIRQSPVRVARVASGEHIVPQRPQMLYGAKRIVFVRIQRRYRAGLPTLIQFVLTNRLVDLLAVRRRVSPRLGKHFRRQRRVRTQELRLRRPEASRVFQQPHGNARSGKASLAPANLGAFFHWNDGSLHKDDKLALRLAARNRSRCQVGPSI